MRVDLKSMFLGIGMILALFVILGQAPKPDRPVGRYQIVMPPYDDGFTVPFLLDTQEGIVYRFFRNINPPEGKMPMGWIICPMDSLSREIWQVWR